MLDARQPCSSPVCRFFPGVVGSVALALFLACTSQSAVPTTPTAAGVDGTSTTPEPPAANAPASGAQAVALTLGVRRSLTSAVLGEERPYLVYTPPGYENGSKRYPVLYLLDGDTHFHHVTGIVSFLARERRMPAMIVVALPNTDRGRDFTPTHDPRTPTSGGADRFVSFLADELMPEVEKTYRVHPYRVLVGHSLGGLLAIHTLLHRPDLFQAYIAISPSLQWDSGWALRTARTRWPAGATLDRFLYFTLGKEVESITRGNREFAAFLEQDAPGGLRWSFEFMEREDHGTTPHRTVYRGLESLFSGWRWPDELTSLAAIKAHYQALSERFGMPVPVPEGPLDFRGYQLLEQGKHAEAIAAFQLNIEMHPDSANVYDSMGEALERSGDLQRALEYYEQATKRGAVVRHPFLQIFMANRDRVAGKLKK